MARTRFQRGDQSDSDCTPGADFNKPLLSAQTGGNETVTSTTVAGNNQLEGSFSMASGDPGGGEDLGSGLWRCQLDITSIGADCDVQVVFHALNAGCTSQASQAMAEGDFTTTGLHIATATWDPPVADRYGVQILIDNGSMHSDPSQDVVFRTNNANAFFEVPDAPAGGLSIPIAMHQHLRNLNAR